MTDLITITRQTEGGQSPLLAVGDIATEYGIKVPTLKQWIHRGQFTPPVARTSGGDVYLREDVETWMRERRR